MKANETSSDQDIFLKGKKKDICVCYKCNNVIIVAVMDVSVAMSAAYS